MSNTGAKNRAAAKKRAETRAKSKSKCSKNDKTSPIVVISSDSESNASDGATQPPKAKRRCTTVQTEEEDRAEHVQQGVEVDDPEDSEAELGKSSLHWTCTHADVVKRRQSVCRAHGLPQSTPSSPLRSPSGTTRGAVATTSFAALRSPARGAKVPWYTGILTPLMRSPPGTSADTRSTAGEWKRSSAPTRPTMLTR